VLDLAVDSAFESTLNSTIVSYRIVSNGIRAEHSFTSDHNNSATDSQLYNTLQEKNFILSLAN